MAAVDYGVANLAALKAAGYNIEILNDAEKAKIMYLTHHLGLKNAKRFIKNEITEDAAWRLLKAQVGSKSATVRGKKTWRICKKLIGNGCFLYKTITLILIIFFVMS